MKIIIVCFSLWACSIAHAALPFGSEFAGDYWSKLDEKAKPAFLTGFCLGTFGATKQSATLYPQQIPKLIPLIDAFYKLHPEPNMLLPYAIQICLMQLEHRPQAEIDEIIKQAQKPWK